MPLHSKRTWCLGEIECAPELASMLARQTWTLCSAFRVQGHPGYIFLNDATNEDGAQEYAVILCKGGAHRQIESITFSWCTVERALELIEEVLAGAYDDASYAYPVPVRIESPGDHGTCLHCA